ncbi:DUF1993 domain-containing protein [Xanthomonas sp. AM6]|uniref:DUF1993 domain-containing protein n=1 Tax=Xanthomonas sp. AM6 TaxID=2982531 RepID=UPI0021D9F209|nr:DUF1993 domain-containing protein [Xanthomonas sp. AM6]UYB51291.1 DUF1993 domain-containing protein [Xanthomonas sp. AM6]
MSVSMYRLSVPVFLRGLNVLQHYVALAERHAQDTGQDPQALVDARLAPDMFGFAGQIQRASDTAKNTIGRLSDIVPPKMADDETTLAQLRARIAATQRFLESVDAATLDGAQDRAVSLSAGKLKADFNGSDYLLTFALPNFFFHVATAHAILRQQGVAVGKLDYLGSFNTVEADAA